ncbi:MAG: hypothetical protein K0U74_11375 [Alphaproteobacteria bacterium]|nr:hypothetical protein [Alphaproteobacteria bacterium]
MIYRTLIAALGTTVFLMAPAPATSAEPTVAPTIELPRTISTVSSRYRETYISTMMSWFRRSAGSDQILEKSDVENGRLAREASQRASRIRNLLQYDLDADGVVTREDVINSLKAKRYNASSLDRQVDRIMEPDSDKDGSITLEELLRYQPQKRYSRSQNDRLADLLAIDPNGDGRLTGNELESVARVIFSRYDVDGDGHISDEENQTWQAARKAAGKRALEKPTASQIANCNLPPPPTGAKVHLVSSYSAHALSNVTIAGQDKTTVTSEIYIEPGDEPIYIIAASKTPRIWRFRGRTERVAAFVGLTYGARKQEAQAGAVGLPRDRVFFTVPETCFRYFSDAKHSEAKKAKALIEAKLGQPVSKLTAKYSLTELALPSGITPPDPAGTRKGTTFIIGGKEFVIRNGRPVAARESLDSSRVIPPFGVDPETYTNFRRYFPGGIVKINPARISTKGNAERYEVLPSYAGIIELLKDGSLEKISSRRFRIAKPIPRYPANLNGSLRVTFVLAQGLSQPDGVLGASCLISEETGKRLAGSTRCK